MRGVECSGGIAYGEDDTQVEEEGEALAGGLSCRLRVDGVSLEDLASQ